MNFPGIMLNEDDSHYFSTRAGAKLTAEKVASWVDQYADTQVKELVLNPNCMRTSYGSKVWDPIWKGYDPAGPDDQPLFRSRPPKEWKEIRRWVHTAWQLHHDGIDPYALWIKRSREKNISPWISMRMNDNHTVNDENAYIHSDFWKQNPQFRRVPYRFLDGCDRAFDYGKQEVRDYHMKLVHELFERYDFDGFELDWMRHGFHFRPGYEQEGVGLLNDFMRQVKELAKKWEQKRGHKISISARVAVSYNTSLGLGMDAVEWARQGYVDLLVPAPFFGTIDNDIRVDLWRKLVEDKKVMLAPGLEILVRPYPAYSPRHFNTLETVRGSAASLLDKGADRIYLFNYMDSETAMEDLHNYPALLREIGSLETIEGKFRRHILTYQDTWAPGEPQSRLLPALVGKQGWGAFRIHTGPKPESGNATLILDIENEVKIDKETLEVRVNGEPCEFKGKMAVTKPISIHPMYGYSIPLSAMKRGYNVIELKANEEIRIGWVEIQVNCKIDI